MLALLALNSPFIQALGDGDVIAQDLILPLREERSRFDFLHEASEQSSDLEKDKNTPKYQE